MAAPTGARVMVLVSGPPGSGKSTLAAPLAEALGLPLLSKDYLKETIWDAMDPPVGDLSWSRRTGAAAMEILWAVAALCDQLVLEANFRPDSDYERRKLASLNARLIEVYCSCPLETAARRYAHRAESAQHHAAHVGRTVSPSSLGEFDRPIALGPVITVDTTIPVDVDAVAEQLQHLIVQPPAAIG